MKLIVLHELDTDKPIYLNAELIDYVQGRTYEYEEDDRGEFTLIAFGNKDIRVREDINEVISIIIEEGTLLSAYSDKLWVSNYERGKYELLEQIKAEFKNVTDEELHYYWNIRDKFIEIIDNHISGKEK